MSNHNTITMRDALIGGIYERMRDDRNIFFLSADMGAPVLDALREDYPDRFINVGIAEQNMVNVATGLALEGFTVYGYAIAAFLLRAYEQIRINLALSGLINPLNVNLIGVGSGVSYDVSGPTHHCLEDLSIMRTLPNIVVCSPCDHIIASRFVDYSLAEKKPKYIRLDGKPLPEVYSRESAVDFSRGFSELAVGEEVCIVSTGATTNRALEVAADSSIGVIDVFLLRPLDQELFYETLSKYKRIITIEEGFTEKGGLDGLVSSVLDGNRSEIRLTRLGFKDSYLFKFGSRDFLYELSGFDNDGLRQAIMEAG